MLNRKIKRGLALFFIFVLTFSFFGERTFAEDYWKIKKVKNVSEIKPYTDMRNYKFSEVGKEKKWQKKESIKI